MMEHFRPILGGLLLMASLTGVTALLFRLIGFSKGDALYLACLTGAVLLYLVSRRALRRK